MNKLTPIQRLIKHIDDNILLGSNWRDKYIQLEKEYTELSNLIAVQDYLLEHGSNDEKINESIRKIRNQKT